MPSRISDVPIVKQAGLRRFIMTELDMLAMRARPCIAGAQASQA